MALNTEIWVNDIVENFIPNNSFIARSVDHSMFVNHKTVHVPNAGQGAAVTKNRSSYPATVKGRTDTDLTYDLDIFETDPMLSQPMHDAELSYDKRQSIIGQSKANLQTMVTESILRSWVPSNPTKIVTSGEKTEAAHIPDATGMRKALSKADIMAVKKKFDKDDIPADGRYMLLDAIMYNQLLDVLTDAETANFLAGANPETGVIGQYLGFNFYLRSVVLKTTTAGNIKDWTATGAATDSAAGLAWHQGVVSRAMGEVKGFENENDATYYGDVVSFSMRAGGAAIRQDKKGIVLIYQGTPE